jgi:hypothetical protein
MPSENISSPAGPINKFKVGSTVFYNGLECVIVEKNKPAGEQNVYKLKVVGEDYLNLPIELTQEEMEKEVSVSDKKLWVPPNRASNEEENINRARLEKIESLKREEAEIAQAIDELRRQILALPYKEYDVKGEIEKKMSKTEQKVVRPFSIVYIEESIKKLLKNEVKSIEKLKVREVGNEIILDAEIVVSKFFITSKISLENAHLVNQGNSIGLKDGYRLSATKAEDKVKDLFSKHINSIGEKIKEYIEREEGKKVEKISIENGLLMVTFQK